MKKKTKLIEIIMATILIVSLALSYKYYIGDKKDQKTAANIESTEEGNSGSQMVKLEKEEFVRTQIVDFTEPLVVYGSEDNSRMKSTDKFEFEFNNFRVMEKLPVELLKEKFLVFNAAYNEDGSLKKENTYIAKVDFKITNLNDKIAATYRSGFWCYHIDEEYEDIRSGTNEGSVFFDSNRGKVNSTGSVIKLQPGESYSDTVYFIIDKVSQENCNLVISVAPLGMNYDQPVGKSPITLYNNAYGLVKINYSDIIWE